MAYTSGSPQNLYLSLISMVLLTRGNSILLFPRTSFFSLMTLPTKAPYLLSFSQIPMSDAIITISLTAFSVSLSSSIHTNKSPQHKSIAVLKAVCLPPFSFRTNVILILFNRSNLSISSLMSVLEPSSTIIHSTLSLQ